MAAAVVKVLESEAAVAQKLCEIVIEKANAAINDRGVFVVGVSGGSAAKFLCSGLPSATTDWTKWRIFFCDERYVPYSDPECTYTIFKDGLVSKVPALANLIYPINTDITVEEAAEDYLKKIRSVLPGNDIPRFDLLVLGMGPDGHTCSLFPGHPLLKETSKFVAPIKDSPKPPPSRVTLTFPVINNAACAVFASCGAGKADILQRVLEGGDGDPLPAAMVRPTDGQVIWILDSAAAAKLKNVQKL
ncbi:6-phosphogluconolactonase-like [Littorina saxatilis]|uniref:6-phosphogluconolactonase n=1 Tax=Littorina saxatilis TaxID=31220 RepID=A0AAN9G498_9CAEN